MTILDRIVSSVRAGLPKRQKQVPPSLLQSLIKDLPSTRSMSSVLRQEGSISIIAEIKRASPSKGIIRKNLDPTHIARLYSDAGARAISVLTEEEHFCGSLADMRQARAGTNLPILRKDFIVDEYQLLEARAFGADAVLLLAAVLSRRRLSDLQRTAHDLGLDCLVEIYEESELDRVDWDHTTIVGVNNRNLHTFEVDVTHSVRILKHVPRHIVRVSESGLKTADQLASLHQEGIDAVLVGETLMRAHNPGESLRNLLSYSSSYVH